MIKKLTQFFIFVFLSVILFGGTMTNENFWTLIDETVKEAGMDNKKYLKILNEKLYKLDDESRYAFTAYVEYYARKAESNDKLLLLMKVIEGSTTDDSFLYFALWLVSRGENVYFEALKNPDNFIKLINPKQLPKHWGSYYAPSFEMLMVAGKNMDEYENMGEIPDEEVKKMDEIYEKRIPEDKRSYFDLARDIDNILPESMKFFKFSKKTLEQSFKYEEQIQNSQNKLEKAEEKSFEELKKDWTFIEMKKETYNLENPRGGFPLNVEMPPYNDSIIINIIGVDKMGNRQVKKIYWLNYKTKEIKNIETKQTIGNYLTQDSENIYFLNSEGEKGEKKYLGIYNRESNDFTQMEIIDDDLKDKNVHLIEMVGKGKDGSGTIHEGKIYFSLSISIIKKSSYQYEFEKEKSYTYHIKDRKIKPLADNIFHIRFSNGKMYYLKLDDFTGKTPYENPKTLVVKDLSTGEEVELLKKVNDYSIDGDKIYYSHKSDKNTYLLSKYENGNKEVIFENSAKINAFSVVNNILYISLFMSIDHSGYIHAFLLNLKDKTICEVPKADHTNEVFLDDEKYVVMSSEYDDRKIFLKVHEVRFN